MGPDLAVNNRSTAYLGMGTNLGDRLDHLRTALHQLIDDDRVNLSDAASVYETSPVGGPPGQSNYLNTVVKITTSLDAPSLLRHILGVEQSMGRVRQEINGPRNIDIDLILMDGLVLDTPTLSLPHPRFHQRSFVLTPLAELAPDLPHPVLKQSVRELLIELPSGDEVVNRFAPPGWSDQLE